VLSCYVQCLPLHPKTIHREHPEAVEWCPTNFASLESVTQKKMNHERQNLLRELEQHPLRLFLSGQSNESFQWMEMDDGTYLSTMIVNMLNLYELRDQSATSIEQLKVSMLVWF
jgi:hypothetical protein